MDLTPLQRGPSPTPPTPPRREDGAADFAEVLEHESLEEPGSSEPRRARERERPDEPTSEPDAFAFVPATWTDLASLPTQAAPSPESEGTGTTPVGESAREGARTAQAEPAPDTTDAPTSGQPATESAGPPPSDQLLTAPRTPTTPLAVEPAPVGPPTTDTPLSSPGAPAPAATAERGLPATSVTQEPPPSPRRGPAMAGGHSLDATPSQDPSPTSEGPAPAAGEGEALPVEAPRSEQQVAPAAQESAGLPGQPEPFPTAAPLDPTPVATPTPVAAPPVAPAAIAGQVGGASPATPIAPAAPVSGAAPPASIVQQVQVAIRPGMSEARIALTPPELGRVAVRLLLRGGSLEARIVAETPAAKIELERHKVELERALSQDGQTVRVEVVSQEPAGVAADARGGSDTSRQGYGARGEGREHERPASPWPPAPAHQAFTHPDRRAVRTSRLDTLA